MRINHLSITLSIKTCIAYGLLRNDAGEWVSNNEAILHSETGCKLSTVTVMTDDVIVQVRSYACDGSDAIRCLTALSKEG